MVSLTILLLAAVSFAQSPPLPSIVNNYVDEFRTDFDQRLAGRNNYRPLLANVVRLAFHFCVGDGGCDGCINMDVPDNAGLELSVNYLDARSDAWLEAGLSKADLYALASMVAANMALGNNGWDSDLSNFEIGRTDCSDPDSFEEFPDAHHAPFQFFEDNFGFNADETTILFGAHTLGRAQLGNSGFNGFWTNNQLELGNEFFERIEDDPWDQEAVGNGNFQWDQNNRFALDADMFLVRNLNPDANGREINNGCRNDFDNCPDAPTLPLVESFLGNQGEMRFQNAFKDVYVRMLRSAGQGFEQELQLVCDIYDCTNETNDFTTTLPDANSSTSAPEVIVDEEVESEEEEPVEPEQPEEESEFDSNSESDSSEDSEDPVVEVDVTDEPVVQPPPPAGPGRGKGRGGRRGGRGKGRGGRGRLLL